MNELLPYEKIIARKLGEISVPGKRALIWDRVNQGIQSIPEHPADESSSAGVGNKYAGFNGVTLTAIIVAMISLVLLVSVLYFKKPTVPGNNKSGAPVDTPVKKSDSTESHEPSANLKIQKEAGKTVIVDSMPSSIQQYQWERVYPAQQDIIKPSSASPKELFKKLPDTLFRTKTIFPVQQQRIGVTGISDSNYRIVMKKDSLK